MVYERVTGGGAMIVDELGDSEEETPVEIHGTGGSSSAKTSSITAYSHPENKVALGFVEGLNNKIRVIQRRAYGLRDEEYLRLKILTCMLKEI